MIDLENILRETKFEYLFPGNNIKEFKKILSQVHPDRHIDNKERAGLAFIHVTNIWERNYKYINNYVYIPPVSKEIDIIEPEFFNDIYVVHEDDFETFKIIYEKLIINFTNMGGTVIDGKIISAPMYNAFIVKLSTKSSTEPQFWGKLNKI